MPIYKEKNKNKIPKDGRKIYFKEYYTDVYGNRKQYQSKYFANEKEANVARAQWLLQTTVTTDVNYSVTFLEVYEEWYMYRSRTKKCTTVYKQKKSFDKNILRFFEKYKLHSIRMPIILKWYDFLEKNISSIDHQNRMINAFKEILNYAVENYDFDKKIVSKVNKKYHSEPPLKSTIDNNFWTYQEFEKFISVVDNQLYCLMFTFLYFTGLRIGEMIALTWNDLDFKNKTLSITKSYTNKAGNKNIRIVSPKTKNSIREIDLDDNLISLLKKHYKSEAKIINFNPSMQIFGNISYITPTTFARKLNFYITKSSVKKITPHGFRHSHASLLIHLGCDSRDVAARLGDTVRVVESTYYHMFPSKKSNTVKALNNLNIYENER